MQMASLQGNTSNDRSVANRIQQLAGSDFITTLQVKGGSGLSAEDRILLRQPISATSFLGTRVSGLSQFWERYRWRKAEMRYVPAVPNTVACQLIAYIDTDPLDDPSIIPDADQLLRQATAQVGARQWNFNTPRTIPLIIRKDDQLYYTGFDKQNLRFSLQGVLYILQVTDLLNFSGDVIENDLVSGSVFLDWVCEFTMPQINPSFANLSGIGFEQVGALRDVNRPTGSVLSFTQVVSGLTPGLEYLLVPQFVVNAGVTTDGIIALTGESGATVSYTYDAGTNSATVDTLGTLSLVANASGAIDFVVTWNIATPNAGILPRFLLFVPQFKED
jgi:hypothetical protein